MRIQAYTRFEDIPLSAKAWNALVHDSVTDTIFQTYEWNSTWWSVFGDQYELQFLLGVEGEDIVGFAALMIGYNEFGRKSLRFLADRNSDYCDFVVRCNPLDFTQAIFDHLAEHQTDWVCMQLRNMPESSLVLASMKSLASAQGWHLHESRPIPTPRRALSKATGQPLKWQYSIRRPFNRMKKEGTLRFRHIEDPDEAQNLLKILIAQHIARYHDKGEPSLFDKQLNVEFFSRLTPILQQAGWLDFCVLEFNDQPVALHYGFNFGDTLIWYKPSFDIQLAHYSPGTVLTKYLIEYAEKRGFHVLDFTIGDEAFKERFCTSRGYNRNLSIYKNKSHACLSGMREQFAAFRHRFRVRRA